MEIVQGFNWKVEPTVFQALDWDGNGAELSVEGTKFEVYPSPYSLGCELELELAEAGTLHDLDQLDCSGKIVLLHGDLAKEQLMPKNFIFFNPEEHQRIIASLERKNPAPIICATSHNASLAGGVYPFPLIEDGDIDIPSVFMTDEEGEKLLPEIGKQTSLISRTRRIQGNAYNLVARKGGASSKRIAISAHIDAKKGTPGAIDNATGVIVLLLLAELLRDYKGQIALELLPFNGEDYYAASGQMIYLDQNHDYWDDILLNINIDGAGFYLGGSALSPFKLPPDIQQGVDNLIQNHKGISEGIPWVQGDHSIFLQQGIPAIAFSSQWFINNIDSQDITHTPKDHPGIVDCEKVVEIAQAIHELINSIVS
jgi:aminopeptidase YwaD